MAHGDAQTWQRRRSWHFGLMSSPRPSDAEAVLAAADIVLSSVAPGQTITTTGIVRNGVQIGAAGLLTEPSGGDLVIFGPISGPNVGTATLGIAGGATLYAAGAISAAVSARFTGAGGTLQLAGLYLPQMTATIAGFAPGQVIDVVSQTLTDAVLSETSGGETLIIQNEGGVIATLSLSDAAAIGSAAYVVPDLVDGSRVVLGGVAPAITTAANGTQSGNVFAWGAATGAGQWDDPAVWRMSGTIASMAPGANDTVDIAGPGSSVLAVAGNAAAATLSTQGLIALSGEFAEGSLLVGAAPSDVLLLDAGSQIVAATATLGDGFLQVAAVNALLDVTGATAVRDGTLWVADGGTVQTASLTLSNGTLRIGASGMLIVGGGSGIAGTVGIAASGIVSGEGTINAPVQNNGVLRASGILDLFGSVSGTGLIQVASGSDVFIPNGVGAGQQLQFQTGSATLELFGSAVGCNAVISGFGIGDVIDIASSTLSQATWSPAPDGLTGTLDLGQAGTLDIAMASGLAASAVEYTMTADGLGGTALQMIPCFVEGTRLAHASGTVAVEQIVPGDRLLTRSGAARRVRWVGSRHYDAATLQGEPQLRPVRISRGALGDGLPTMDLSLSPQHAIALVTPAGLRLVPAIGLVDGRTIRRETPPSGVAYYHVELDEHDLLLSAGVAVESFLSTGIEGRALFQREAGQQGCAVLTIAPRLEHGAALEDLRVSMGLLRDELSRDDIQLAGHIDRLEQCGSGFVVEGWAACISDSQHLIRLRCAVDGRVQGYIVANKWRPDLDHAGYGGGSCSFSARFSVCDRQAKSYAIVELIPTGLPPSPILSYLRPPLLANGSSVR